MTDVIDQPKDGDVFRWHYLDPEIDDRRPWGNYHCCSCIGIFRNGRLRDTYWTVGAGSDGRSFAPDEFHKLRLEHLGNLDDYNQAPEYQADYYADADIMNLNHPNSTRGNFYLRKGAQRSAAKMLEVARHRLERSESDERSASHRSGELRKAIAQIEGGATDVHLF